jgi:hypothetical protein
MTAIASRVELDLVGGTEPVVLSAEQVAGGYRVSIDRARQPLEAWDGAGDLHLVQGPGHAVRVLTITATTWGYAAAPDLAALELQEVDAVVYWAVESAETTTVRGVLRAGRLEVDQLDGGASWTVTVAGTVTDGRDPYAAS